MEAPFLMYFLPLILCFLVTAFLVTCVKTKGYFGPIMAFVASFVPVLNWIFCLASLIILVVLLLIGEDEFLKENKITKFLFGVGNEQ